MVNAPGGEVGPAPPKTPARPLPRYRRAGDDAPGIILTERDVAVLEDVWHFGLLTTSQIEALRCADPQEPRRFVSRLPLTRRLKLLFHHRYLRRIPRPQTQGSLEMVYVLDAEGARILSLRHGDVRARTPSRLPRSSALEHQLGIVQFRVSIATASALDPIARGFGLQLADWLSGDKVRFRVELDAPAQRRQQITTIPDAALSFRAERLRQYAFLEVDRGTEPKRTLADKARAYAEYWRCGGFARDFNVPPGLGFRVLFVAPSPKRAKTILEAVAAHKCAGALFLVAGAEVITPQLMAAPVWEGMANDDKVRFWQAP